MPEKLFRKILHAYDGSENSLDAFTLALTIAEQAGSELHIVSVAEIDYVPQFVGDVRQQSDGAAQWLRSFLFRAEPEAAGRGITLHSHVLVGHPVRAIARLALDLDVELLVIGARGHSALYERLVGSRAAQIMQIAHCPVLVVKGSNQRRRAKNKLSLTRLWGQIVAPSASSRWETGTPLTGQP